MPAMEMLWINVNFNSFTFHSLCPVTIHSGIQEEYAVNIDYDTVSVCLRYISKHYAFPCCKTVFEWLPASKVAWIRFHLFTLWCQHMDLSFPNGSVARVQLSTLYWPLMHLNPPSWDWMRVIQTLKSTQICVSGQFMHLFSLCNWLYSTAI